ncbi:SUMF1/EgtB/PvdO family nonheme iron enzyme [bacterium]|nr:SUMF1/EgtB/PvdO family nonheme iron enzyme [bacterium]
MNERPTHRSTLIGACLAILALVGCGEEPAPPSVPMKVITTAGGAEMVCLPAGEFAMGSASGEPDERPMRTVSLDSFCIDKTEVTQEQYEDLVGRNPSRFKNARHPVESVSWRAAAAYCNLRSMSEGLEPCYDRGKDYGCNVTANGYRLPTEAEWEYACRAGGAARFAFGDDPRLLDRNGWYAGNAGKTTRPVGAKLPNPWGLFDMHGNVAEWCHDRYGGQYYEEGVADNPLGPSQGTERVARGGSWKVSAERCRAAARASETPVFTDACFGRETYGLRCVRRAP